MKRLLVRQLALTVAALVAVSFVSYSYAILAQSFNGSAAEPFSLMWLQTRLIDPYLAYLRGALSGDFGTLAYRGSISGVVLGAAVRSGGLVAVAFLLSAICGLALGLQAVWVNPPRVASWLIPLSTLAIATPSFYIGIVAISCILLLILYGSYSPALPFQGFGWDRHLILPVLALSIRPTFQIAQAAAQLLSEELRKNYVTFARSLGFSWRKIRWHSALRNVAAPLLLTMAGSFRSFIGELILVEALFNWSGIGRLVAEVLIPLRNSASTVSPLFLNAPLFATLMLTMTFVFLGSDFISSLLAHLVDPRIQKGGMIAGNHGEGGG